MRRETPLGNAGDRVKVPGTKKNNGLDMIITEKDVAESKKAFLETQKIPEWAEKGTADRLAFVLKGMIAADKHEDALEDDPKKKKGLAERMKANILQEKMLETVRRSKNYQTMTATEAKQLLEADTGDEIASLSKKGLKPNETYSGNVTFAEFIKTYNDLRARLDKEAKADTDQATNEETSTEAAKEEEPKIDREYIGNAASLFAKRRAVMRQGAGSPAEQQSVSSYYDSMSKVFQKIGQGKEVKDADASPVLIDSLEAMYADSGTEEGREDAKTVFEETYKKLNPSAEAESTPGGKIRKFKRRVENAVSMNPQLSTMTRLVDMFEISLKSAKGEEARAGLVRQLLRQISIESGKLSREAFERHQRRNETNDQKYDEEKRGFLALAEGVFELHALSVDFDRLAETAAAKKRTTEVHASAAAEDSVKVTEIRKTLESQSHASPAPETRPSPTTRATEDADESKEKTPTRAEAKKAFAQQLKRMKDVTLKCYQEIERLQSESGLAMKIPFTKSNKQYSALMALSADIELAALPERYMKKTKAEMDSQAAELEKRFADIIG